MTNLQQVQTLKQPLYDAVREDRIGAVNQLAAQHYVEQISRYKELSVRLNELEREKQAIVAFMDEIEAKKRRVFMTAFDKINASLSVYFKKMTGGGSATLKLENPEEPFTGGIAMICAVPNKTQHVSERAPQVGERSISSGLHSFFCIKRVLASSVLCARRVDRPLGRLPYHSAGRNSA
jgi:chromosome segregation protein